MDGPLEGGGKKEFRIKVILPAVFQTNVSFKLRCCNAASIRIPTSWVRVWLGYRFSYLYLYPHLPIACTHTGFHTCVDHYLLLHCLSNLTKKGNEMILMRQFHCTDRLLSTKHYFIPIDTVAYISNALPQSRLIISAP